MKVSKKTRARRKSIKALDEAARQACFERDGYKCVFCGSDRNIQWMHILSRRDLGLRWDEDNSVAGCAKCHLEWHNQPLIGVGNFIRLFPERYDRLIAKRASPRKITAHDLKEMADGIN